MKRMLLVVLCAAFFYAPDAHAQLRGYDAMRPARSTGSAGLGRSFAGGGNSLFLNPASFALASQYVLGTTYTLASQNDTFGDKFVGHSIGVEWTDSTPNTLHMALGLGYNLLIMDDKSTNHVHGGLAYVYRSQAMTFALGVGGHWSEDFATDGNLWSGDVGLGFNFLNQFMIGVVGYNVLNNDMENQPVGVGGGVSYWAGPLVVSADISSMIDTVTRGGKAEDVLMSYIGGVQYMLVNDIFIRGAFRYDANEETPAGDAAEKSLAAGVTAVLGQRVAFEVGYQHNIDATEDFMLGFTIELYSPFGR